MAKAKHLLGMNARNLVYIKNLNPKKLKDIVDDKLKTKTILKKAGIPVPKLIKVFRTAEDIQTYDYEKLPNSFVVKPDHGFGGGGIMVVYGKKKDAWILQNGSETSVEDIKLHLFDILDGSFSLKNIPDTVYIEKKLKTSRAFKKYTYRGAPDIRVIAYNNVPIMAMLRLPTEESGGRANLHQGAIGVGIDIASGITTYAVYRNKYIKYVPGTKTKLNGFKIPQWEDILRLAIEAQQVLGLGYIGVDIVIDKEEGPLILEVNARPGLGIQLANKAPLKRRLERVEDLTVRTADKGIRIAKELFGTEMITKTPEIAGRLVIPTISKVKLLGTTKKKKTEILAKIDTGAWRTSICLSLAEKLGFDDPKYHLKSKRVWSSMGTEKRPVISLTYFIEGKKIQTKAFITNREALKHDMIIGRKDLKGFLVDTSKHLELKRSYLEDNNNRSE